MAACLPPAQTAVLFLFLCVSVCFFFFLLRPFGMRTERWPLLVFPGILCESENAEKFFFLTHGSRKRGYKRLWINETPVGSRK